MKNFAKWINESTRYHEVQYIPNIVHNLCFPVVCCGWMLANKNIEKHTADIIVSWPNPIGSYLWFDDDNNI